MAITTADIDAVRRLYGDTDSANQVLEDRDVVFFLSENDGNLYKAAADCAAALAARYAARVDVRVGILSTSDSQLSAHYRQLAADLRTRADGRLLEMAIPFAGGVSLATKAATEEDDDRTPPAFTRTLHEESDSVGGEC